MVHVSGLALLLGRKPPTAGLLAPGSSGLIRRQYCAPERWPAVQLPTGTGAALLSACSFKTPSSQRRSDRETNYTAHPRLIGPLGPPATSRQCLGVRPIRDMLRASEPLTIQCSCRRPLYPNPGTPLKRNPTGYYAAPLRSLTLWLES